MRSHPLWRLGHTWGIRVISTRCLDIGFSECCLFSFLLDCFLPLPYPQQCLIWGNISQTGIYKHDYVSLKIVRTFNTWLMATLLNFSSLFSSTRPLRVFPSTPQHFLLPALCLCCLEPPWPFPRMGTVLSGKPTLPGSVVGEGKCLSRGGGRMWALFQWIMAVYPKITIWDFKCSFVVNDDIVWFIWVWATWSKLLHNNH